MTILITGVNGFLGSTIARLAKTGGIDFRGTDIQEKPFVSEIDYLQADITDPNSLSTVAKGITGVIHAAGLAHIFSKNSAISAPFDAINVRGTVNIMNAAKRVGVQRFVLISSVSVYGRSAQSADESTPCAPSGPYAESKWQAERHAIEIANKIGMDLVILRLATLYGEGDPGNVKRLIRVIDNGRFLWIGKGTNRKSLLYNEDAAMAALAAMQPWTKGIDIFNVSSPSCSMRDIVKHISHYLKKPVIPIHIPASPLIKSTRLLSYLTGGKNGGFHALYETLKKWVADDYYNTMRIEKNFDFHTRTSLAEGLLKEVEWYKKSLSENL